jgi:hypothetical protein
VSLGSEEGTRESKNLAVTLPLLRAAMNLGLYAPPAGGAGRYLHRVESGISRILVW